MLCLTLPIISEKSQYADYPDATVLIVDDEEDHLRNHGCLVRSVTPAKCLSAGNGQEGA